MIQFNNNQLKWLKVQTMYDSDMKSKRGEFDIYLLQIMKWLGF